MIMFKILIKPIYGHIHTIIAKSSTKPKPKKKIQDEFLKVFFFLIIRIYVNS